MIKILFVCHGNICRSPMAEFIMKDLTAKSGLHHSFHIASAATSMEEIGNGVHPGTRQILKNLGINCASKQAVRMKCKDYESYDYLIAMDQHNIKNMIDILGGDPGNKVFRLLDFTSQPRDIADPWYTGDFDKTYEDILAGCRALLAHIQRGTALNYLRKDHLLNIGMTEPICRGHAEIIYASAEGVLLKETKDNIYMMSVDTLKKGRELLKLLTDVYMFVANQKFMVEEVKNAYGLTHVNPCYQAVYTKERLLPLRNGISIRPLDISFHKEVCDHYHLINNPSHMAELLESGVMHGVFVEETLAGFIGMHSEGSIGLLEVFEPYRRQGLALELQKYMINFCLKNGQIPFGQVIVGNEASMSLQQKIGMEFAEGIIYWIY